MNDRKDPARIVVVGAGIVGASIAFQLTLHGAQVTVVDAGEPGQGASAVSFAWINARDKNPRHYHDLNRRSLDMWDRFAWLLGEDVGLTWGGELRWAATPAGAKTLTERVRTLQSWGYPIRLLTAAELKQMEPSLAPGAVAAASYTAIDGHVDTGRVIRACLARATERGAVARSQSRVAGLELAQSGAGTKVVKAIRTEQEEIPCDIVVLAGGPDTSELAALAGITLPLYHTFGATIITEPIEPVLQQAAVVHTPHDLEPLIALRQLPDGSVMIHGGNGGASSGSLGRIEAEIQQVVKAAASFFPALEGVQIKEVRQGRRPIPRDGHSILGFAQNTPNLYLAVTHSGVTLAALIGELAALEISAGVRVDLLEPYRLERF